MACEVCTIIPQTRLKHSYELHIAEKATGRIGRCIMQSECQHEMLEWLQGLAATGQLSVHDQSGEKFWITDPVVVNVDEKAAAHIPIVDPVN